jgi:hypothetical protein
LVGDVVYDVVLDAPLYKVELRDSRVNLDSVRVWNLVLKLFGSAKRVKQLFTVAIETRLVRAVDQERFAVVGLVRQVLLLGVVRDEPLKVS